MARLILRAPYYQPSSRVPSGATRGGYANYIATREGVEMLPRGGMVGYVGERRGSHGLFSDDGDPVNLAQIKEEMNEHPGNIWGLIFSLKQEDAERLSYNQASQWVSLLRSHRNDIAREMHIAPGNLRWYCRAALDKAVAEKLIRQNPAIGCKLPSKKSAEIKILTPEAMQKLLFQAQKEDFYEMFVLDLATGLRRGEVVGLQWKDIDFEKGTLSITKQIRYVKGKLVIAPPKTKASERTIILPPPILEMLAEYRNTVNSVWLFPSPVKKEDVPRDPSACRKALARILKRAECEHVPFHAMRHTFASNAFHYGMDVKTLACTIGHESVETTLNVYAHSSEQMKRDAAKKIDEAIGTVLGADVIASDASWGDKNGEAQEPTSDANKPKTVEFKPYQPKYRKRGTGSVHQVSKNVWEGRYTPTVNGKRIARNIYADSEEECEIKLEALIREMKAEFGIR